MTFPFSRFVMSVHFSTSDPDIWKHSNIMQPYFVEKRLHNKQNVNKMNGAISKRLRSWPIIKTISFLYDILYVVVRKTIEACQVSPRLLYNIGSGQKRSTILPFYKHRLFRMLWYCRLAFVSELVSLHWAAASRYSGQPVLAINWSHSGLEGLQQKQEKQD